MTGGFSVLEVIIALTLSLGIFSLIITNVSESTAHSQKITQNQQLLESIFHTVDTIKMDLSKCGMRLQEARKHFNISLFEHTGKSFRMTYGQSSEFLGGNVFKGEKIVNTIVNGCFKKRKKVLIYNPDIEIFEFNEIKDIDGNRIHLANSLKHDYFKNSLIVVLKQIEYKFFTKQNILKRKLDRGYFQPLIEKVTDFYITFFPESNSVLYRIEVNNREQIRGYIFLTNMVKR